MPNLLRHSRNGQGELPVRTAAPLRFAQNVACCAHRQLTLSVATCGRLNLVIPTACNDRRQPTLAAAAFLRALNQRAQTLRHFPQNRQHAMDSLFGGLELNRHAHRQSALHIPFVVSQGHSHAAIRQVELLLRQRPVLRANAGQLGAHPLGIGDGVRGEGFEFVVGQPGIRRFFAQEGKQQHACASQVTRHTRSQREAGVHAAVLSVARDVDQVVTVEHGDKRNFLCAHRQALQRGLNDARQARGLQIRLAESHDLGREPKQLAVAGDKAQVQQRQQIASCGCSRQAAALTRLGSRQAGVVLIKGLQHGNAFVQTCNPVFLVHVHGMCQKCVRHVCRGKPVMRSMIAQKRSFIAQFGFIYPTEQTFPIKFHTSDSFGLCAAGFITPS